MTSRERVQCILDHKKPDRVAIDMGSTASGFTNSTFFRLKEHFGITEGDMAIRPDESAAYYNDELLERLGGDFRHVYLLPPDDFHFELDADGYGYSEWGIKKILMQGMMQLCSNPLENATIEDIDNYPWPDPYNPGRIKGLRERAKHLYENTDYAIAARAVSHGFFELAWELRSMNKLLVDLIINKEFACHLMDKILDIQIKMYDVLLTECGEYIQIVETADDYGTQNGPFMSMELFEELIVPRRKKLNDFIHAKAPHVKIFHHTCGSVYKLMPQLIDCGIDVLNPVQPGAVDMDTYRLQKEYGDKMIFHGSIDEQSALISTLDDLRTEMKERIASLGRDGGYIMAPTSNFQDDMPLENIINFASMAKELGQYD